MLVNHIMGNDSDNFIKENANINSDEKITVTDVMVLVNMIQNGYQKPFNVVTNIGDVTIGYGDGGNGSARAGENNHWDDENQ